MGNRYVARIKNSRKGIEDAFKSFMARYFNKGPRLARVYIIENCIIVYCKEFLTQLEKNLINDKCGEYLIHASRKKIIQNNKEEFLNIVKYNYEGNVGSFYIDFNIFNDSLCCVFLVD